MFYTFNQNNTGGEFTKDPQGIGRYVIIEAANADDANALAENVGIYFDGCAEGRDCECCGDRWDRVDEWEATESPEVYSEPPPGNGDPWFKPGECICVHYLDGRKEWI